MYGTNLRGAHGMCALITVDGGAVIVAGLMPSAQLHLDEIVPPLGLAGQGAQGNAAAHPPGFEVTGQPASEISAQQCESFLLGDCGFRLPPQHVEGACLPEDRVLRARIQ